MSINEKIEEIISARKSKIKNIEKSVENLSKIKDSIDKFEDFRDSLENDNSFDNIKNIDVKKLKEERKNINNELKRLLERFSRPFIHLTFVGEMGSGKSLVMQRISGLDDTIIPSSKGRSCTGTKSIITNSEDEEDVKAKITFFTEQEIINIINDYLETVYDGKILKVNSIDDIKKKFSSKSLDDAEFKKLESKFSVNRDKKTYLKKYIYHIDDFKKYLGKEDEIVSNRDDIAKYIAQYEIGDIDKEYYNFLAVKEVNIKCHFPSTECSKIVLVDTVGLGETSLKVKEKMLEAVKNDSDAILYLFFPRTDRTDMKSECSEIVDNIIEQVGEEYTKRMLFWILNERKDGEEEYKKIIPKLMKEVEEKDWAICKALKVDCNDVDEVKDKLLKPILTQISENLEDIDNILLSDVQQMLDKLFRDYSAFVEKIENLSEDFICQGIDELFAEIDIEDFFDKNLSALLKDFSSEYEKKIEQGDKELKESFFEQLKNIYDELPDEEKIRQYFRTGKGNNEKFEHILSAIRICIINNFFRLDDLLMKKVKDFKMKIVHILSDDDKGRFCHILPICDDPDKWLEDFLKIIGKDKKFGYMYKTIEILKDFNLTAKNYLIYEIRNSLTYIDRDKKSIDLDLETYSEDYSAEIIKEEIEQKVNKIYKTIKDNSSGYLDFYNKAFFAVAKDFHDRVQNYYTLGSKNVKYRSDEWIDFYKKNVSKIWSEKYKEFLEKSEKSEFFKDIIEKLNLVISEKNIFTIK